MLRRRRFLSAAAGVGVAGGVGATTGTAGCLDRTDGTDADDASDGGAAAADYDFRDRPTVVAHRGFAGAYPENTIDAFEAAAEGVAPDREGAGADWIELDALPTSDGEVVVFHDEELGGLTDATGVVYETPAEEVLSAEVLDSGNAVPTLSDAMAAIPDDVGVNVELKHGSDAVERGRASDPEGEREEWEWLEAVVDVLSDHDHEVLCSSFFEGALFAMREIEPDLPLAYVFSEGIEEGLAVTDEYDAAAVSAPIRMVEGTSYYDPDSHDAPTLVEEVHDRGLPIHVWTVETWHQAEQLNAVGVDGLFLDYPEVVRWGDAR